MIATCPACGKRYRLADDAVPPEGRVVRCAACSHGWLAMRDPLSSNILVSVELPSELSPAGLPGANTAYRANPAAATRAFSETAPPAIQPRDEDPASTQPRAAAEPIQPNYPPAAPIQPDDEAAPRHDSMTQDLHDAAVTTAYLDEAATIDELPPRRGRKRWIVLALLLLAAIGATAALVLIPSLSRRVLPGIDVPHLSLSGITLPALDLPKLSVPKLALPTIALPPVDLTRIPYIGDRLEQLVYPLPVPESPLRIVAGGERRRLANGSALLVLSGKVSNPTALPQVVPPIEARLVDPAGHVALRWRIAPPVAVLPGGHSVAFDSSAANYPPNAERLDLVFAKR
ncbi:MAG: zinc-ribbon domain-containing protein [Janthinobacterium lividum]